VLTRRSFLITTPAIVFSRLGAAEPADYFPPPESKGGWRTLTTPDDIRRFRGCNNTGIFG